MSDWVEGSGGLRKSRAGSWRILYTVDFKERMIDNPDPPARGGVPEAVSWAQGYCISSALAPN